jgi:hypothetical protein
VRRETGSSGTEGLRSAETHGLNGIGVSWSFGVLVAEKAEREGVRGKD